MTNKELKNLAKKIAKAELILQSSDDKKERTNAMQAIMTLSSSISSLEEMDRLDNLIQDILKKEK